jgi:hypothetical protein
MDTVASTPAAEAPTTRDRPFNPFRTPKSDRAKALVGDVINQLQNYESHRKLRKRKRKAQDQVNFEAAVSAIICDLIHRELGDTGSRLSLSLSKAVLQRPSRYEAPSMSKTLPDLVKRLASREMEFLEFVKGTRGYFNDGRRTTIRAGKRLVRRIHERALSLDDIGTSNTEEVIILKRRKTDHWEKGERIPYKDTPTTRRYRNQLQRINSWLEAADITFDPTARPKQVVDATDRRLRRYFNNGSFKEGGRLFGGFWMNLTKRQRREGISIDGRSVVCLDYAQMGPKIVYGMVGAAPPEKDAYRIAGLKQHRAGIKKVFNALLCASKPITRFPAGTKELFPRYTSVEQVIAGITAEHGAIAHLFCKGIGLKTMLIESNVLVAVLLALIDKEVVALPTPGRLPH